MKNFKIVMILVAAVAFFCSCGGEKTVTVTMTNDVVTYDLASANSLPVSITCNVKADAGIQTLKITKTIKNGEETVGNVVEYEPAEDPAGLTDYSFEIADTLYKSELAAGYKVVFDVAATDKKDNAGSESVTINVVETATPIAANWSANIILSNQTWANYNGAARTGQEDATIGVKYLEKNDHKAYNLYAEPTTGASWVFVENIDNLTTNEALVEAFNNGTPVTSRTMFPATDQGKAYQEKFFISKNNNGEYVLVDYVAGQMSSTTGNVMVFKYKKAETSTPAAK
jgi:hypothetical protein